MDIVKFDPKVHDIDRAAELVLSAYGLPPAESAKTKQTVMSLIESGNNFLGHENIYVLTEDSTMSGLLIGYPGKSGGIIRALMSLLSELRLMETLNLIVLHAELLHTGYTPQLSEDDFYISLVVVDESLRGGGYGKSLIQKAFEIARDKGCGRVVLDVDLKNEAARALYEKMGFRLIEESPKSVNGAVPSAIYTMECSL